MFIVEEVTPKDKELYKKIAEHSYFEGLSKWCVDRNNDIFIVCIGKHGIETPVFFHMCFKGHLFEFYIPEPDILYGNAPVVHVELPEILTKKCSMIEVAIKSAFRETNGMTNYGGLPKSIDDHIFEFNCK